VALLGILLFAAAAAAAIMGHFAASLPAMKLALAPVGLFLSAVFLLRGVVGVLPAFERAAPEQPYLSLNRRVYSPFCALIGFGFLALTFSLPNWAWHFSRLTG
jgi:hypothetical protein